MFFFLQFYRLVCLRSSNKQLQVKESKSARFRGIKNGLIRIGKQVERWKRVCAGVFTSTSYQHNLLTHTQTLTHTHRHRCAVNKHNLADCFVKSQVASQRLNRPQIIRAATPTRAHTKHCFLLHVCLSCLFRFAPGIMYKVSRVSKGQGKVVRCTKVGVTL